MRSLSLGLVPLCIVGLIGAARAEAPRYHSLDDQQRQSLRESRPEAANKVIEGEELLAAGKLAAAEKRFAEAKELAPLSSLILRRHCQALTELGRRTEALDVCERALVRSATPMAQRALVGALMSGDGAPASEDVARAVDIATSVVEAMPNQPWGYAALCDIAFRVGDDQMFDEYLRRLQQIAPDHAETRRFSAARAAAGGGSSWSLLAWGAVAVAALGSAVHALSRRRQRRPALLSAIGTGLLLAGALVSEPVKAQDASPAPPAQAAQVAEDPDLWQLSSWKINPKDPESSVPSAEARNKNPLQFGYLLQDLAAIASKKERKKDYAASVKYWRAIAMAVPDMATGFSNACRVYELLKDREQVVIACGRALSLSGATAEDFSRYAKHLLAKPSPLTAEELADVTAVTAHLKSQPGNEMSGFHYDCELGVRQGDAKLLRACSTALAKQAPRDPRTLAFQWSLAMLEKDYSGARQTLALAASVPAMKRETLAEMERATGEASVWWKRPLQDWRWGLSALLVIAAGAGLLLALRIRGKRGGLASPATPITEA